MKIKSTFHALVFFMAVLIFSMPIVTLAQQNSVQSEAIAAAEVDAEVDTNTTFWFVVGCFGSLFGLLYANYNAPSAPASRLLGKSPEYVAFYSDAYTIKAKKLQTDQAVRGCIANAVAQAACGCLYVAAFAAAAESY